MTNPENPYQPTEPNRQPDGQPEAPQFGQRSENWQSNPTPNEGSGQSPWPVYQPGAPQQPHPQQAGPGGPTYGAAYPGAQPPQQYPGYGPVPPPENLPSRTWPIVTLVAGVIAMVIVAPALLVTMTISGLDISSLADGSMSVYNGGAVVVDDSESIVFIAQGNQDPNTCTLSQGDTEIILYQESATGLVSGNGIPSGTYTVQCDIPDGAGLYAFGGDQMTGMFSGVASGLIWSSIVGVLGLAATIVGIVWLVRRNRARREILRGQWGTPQPR